MSSCLPIIYSNASANNKDVAQSLNNLLGRSLLKRRQFIEFLIQLAFVDNGLTSDEDKVLRDIVSALHIAPSEYEAMLHKFDNMTQNKVETMGIDEAYRLLGVHKNDDMNTIKRMSDIVLFVDKGELSIHEDVEEAIDIYKNL